MKEDFTRFKTAFWPVYLVVICTLERPFPVFLRVIFYLYLICGVRVVCSGLVINLYSRSCLSDSSANNSLTLLFRLLSTLSFFTSRFNSYVLEVIDLEDRKRFRSTSNIIKSGISISNYIEGFHISINYSNIVFRDLGSILIYVRPGYENSSTL